MRPRAHRWSTSVSMRRTRSGRSSSRRCSGACWPRLSAPDFGEYRGQVIASIRRPGHAKAFSRTTRTSHVPAEARLADVTAPALVVMGEQDPDFPDPRAEADSIARALRGEVVMVPEAGHYPQSQRPDITTGAVLRFLETVRGRA